MVACSIIRVRATLARFRVRGSRFERSLPDPTVAATSPLAPSSNLEPRISNLPASADAGFTLIELIVVMTIIGILMLIAIPAYKRSIQSAQEAVLKEDLYVLRRAIDSYTVDKQQAPQSLDDLVSSGYVREIPKDPFTHQRDWITDSSGMLASIDQSDSGGIDDIHSAAQKTALDGTSYNTW